MGKSLTRKIMESHIVEGQFEPGREVGLRVDQTLVQDATGTMAYLQFEAIGLDSVRTRPSVIYVDHNTLQTGFENADDHLFLQTISRKYGVYFSKAGNGICHQVHLERFAKPGVVILGADSHTPTAGGVGALAMGAGGLDVAVAAAGSPYYVSVPKVVNVRLRGQLGPWVSAKDVILEVLRRLGVRGGLGKVLEYTGAGVGSLSVPERATIANMGTETGALSSIFPSDARTLEFLRLQGREQDWIELYPDPDADYDEVIEVDLGSLEPMVACPHMPDNVKTVREVGPIAVNQVIIGSCTNSSYWDLMRVGLGLKGRHVHPDVSACLVPGSRQVLTAISRNGILSEIVRAGFRVLECACGPCIGMGQAPPSGGVSVRTFNRNFKGRSGTADASVYLCSPEVALATAITGRLTDPRELGECPAVPAPERLPLDDALLIPPRSGEGAVEVRRGPNIKPLPTASPLPESMKLTVLIKVGDDITTDDIMPAGAKVLPLRSNIPAMAEYVFERIDPGFPSRARQAGSGVILGGANYGQGSSREHAALAPMYLGVRAVIAKSFARIHQANLVNFGILPLTLENPADYNGVDQGDLLEIPDVRSQLAAGVGVVARNLTKGTTLKLRHSLTSRQVQVVSAGGLLNFVRG